MHDVARTKILHPLFAPGGQGLTMLKRVLLRCAELGAVKEAGYIQVCVRVRARACVCIGTGSMAKGEAREIGTPCDVGRVTARVWYPGSVWFDSCQHAQADAQAQPPFRSACRGERAPFLCVCSVCSIPNTLAKPPRRPDLRSRARRA